MASGKVINCHFSEVHTPVIIFYTKNSDSYICFFIKILHKKSAIKRALPAPFFLVNLKLKQGFYELWEWKVIRVSILNEN